LIPAKTEFERGRIVELKALLALADQSDTPTISRTGSLDT